MSELRVLTWRGGWGRALRAAVSQPFERESGVRVLHTEHVGLRLPEALTRALASGARPPVDVVWSHAVPALRAWDDGQCEPLALPVLRELGPRARPEPPPGAAAPAAADPWPLVHPYVVHYVLVYTTASCGPGGPRSWSALLEPRRRGRVALYPGAHGFHAIAQVMGGGRAEDIPRAMAPCWTYLRALRPQLGALAYSIGMERALATGELELCFRALPNALAFREAGLALDWCVPAEGTSDTVDALWIPRGVPEPARDAAARFIAFALRREVQERWCTALGALPVHPGAAAPVLFAAARGLPRRADDERGLLRLPERVALAHGAEWEARFAALPGGAEPRIRPPAEA